MLAQRLHESIVQRLRRMQIEEDPPLGRQVTSFRDRPLTEQPAQLRGQFALLCQAEELGRTDIQVRMRAAAESFEAQRFPSLQVNDRLKNDCYRLLFQ